MTDPLDTVFDYHESTKHHLHRYAQALGYMDWATQPDPFRRFEGAPVEALEEVPPGPEPRFDAVLAGAVESVAPLDRGSISQLLYDCLALSAWKEYQGTRWSLRVNPSSGNLHPTEGYVVTGPVPGLCEGPAVFHYAPFPHALELRRELAVAHWDALGRGLPSGALLVGLTSIHWRESWKYGERAFRYCHHDAGHAIGAVALAAAALGWEARVLEGVADDDLGLLLGVHEQQGIEAEQPDCLIAVFPRGESFGGSALKDYGLSRSVVDALRGEDPLGEPNRLSEDHHEWEIIDDVAAAARRDGPAPDALWSSGPAAVPTPEAGHSIPERPVLEHPVLEHPVLEHRGADRSVSARQMMRQRRSAVAMDGETSISRETFLAMLARLHPRGVPFRALPWRPRVHLALFVHRVDGLAPGLYCQVRDPAAREPLAAAMRQDFLWAAPEGGDEGTGLHLLVPLDCKQAARTVSCHQDIAADGAFALGMLAEYADSLRELGPWFYKRLHWEAGAIGQVLYLEAEAAGIRSTGIGCFFDDAMHQVFGMTDLRYQTLYHFTVGGPVEDGRLQTLPPYGHREEPAQE